MRSFILITSFFILSISQSVAANSRAARRDAFRKLYRITDSAGADLPIPIIKVLYEKMEKGYEAGLDFDYHTFDAAFLSCKSIIEVVPSLSASVPGKKMLEWLGKGLEQAHRSVESTGDARSGLKALRKYGLKVFWLLEDLLK